MGDYYADPRHGLPVERGFFARLALRRRCFHHDRITGTSWIEDRIIDLGRAKIFWCTRCDRSWVT